MADVITRLKIESGEYDSKIKRAVTGLQNMEQECRRVDGTLAILEKDQKQYVQSLGQMQTVSRSVRGKIGELSNAFVELRAQYNRLTEDEKKGDFGKALSSSLEQLKTRIKDAKTELNGIQGELNGSKFGQFGGVIDTIGHKLGLTANATELLTSKTALMYAGIGAGIAIVTKATEAWVGYNNELAKQDQITTVTTGLKGEDADRMTDKMRALSDTYKVDFREAINAANTLMTQFGKTGDEATQLIKDGMQGMIQGDGPKLLSMIRQYAPAFRDAGVSASQLVAIIQNSEGGIFTDQNMNAIVMGIKNIRLMTKKTSEALQKLGIDGQEMTRKLNDGSLTIFDALKQVASQLKNVDSNSQAAGEVMQAVFGRQGVTAGTNIAKAIETLNTNLEETKKQTGEVGDAFVELQEANEKLNKAIRDCFEYDGWEQMATGIKAKLVTALADVLDKLGEIKKWFAETAPDWLKEKPQPVNNTKVDTDYISRGATKQERQERYTRVTSNIQKKLNNLDTQEANLGKPYSYIDKNGGLVEQIDTPEQIAQKRRQITASRQQLNKRLQVIQAQESTLVVEPPKTPTKIEPIYTPTGSHKATPAEQADAKYDQAQKDYNQALEQAAMEVKAGTITSAEGKKKELQATETLWKAIGDAREVYDSPKLQEEQKKVETAYTDLAAEVRKASQQMATGISGLTPEMLASGQADIKKQMQTVELGSEEYNQLTQRLFDFNAVSSLMQEAVKSGLEIDDSVKEYFVEALTGPLGENIPQALYDSLVESLNEFRDYAGENPIELDTKTGSVKESKTKDSEKSDQQLQKITSGMSQVISGLQMVGIKVPESIQTALTVIQGAMTLVQGVSSLITVIQSATVPSQIAAETANTTASVANTAALSALTAAVWANTASSFIPFANGGIVPHAADGYFVGGNRFSGDLTPIMANAGELILNKTQQSTLAQELERGDEDGIGGQPYVTGEMIYLGLNNYTKANGYGEVVTTRR